MIDPSHRSSSRELLVVVVVVPQLVAHLLQCHRIQVDSLDGPLVLPVQVASPMVEQNLKQKKLTESELRGYFLLQVLYHGDKLQSAHRQHSQERDSFL